MRRHDKKIHMEKVNRLFEARILKEAEELPKTPEEWVAYLQNKNKPRNTIDELPVDYRKINSSQRAKVRLAYIEKQNGLCYYCKTSLKNEAPQSIRNKEINWNLFPRGFLNSPVHLQHNHDTGMTEGVVHNYCNAVMWQYEGR